MIVLLSVIFKHSEKNAPNSKRFYLIPREISRLIFFWWRLDPARCTFHRFKQKIPALFFLSLLHSPQNVPRGHIFWHTKAHSMMLTSEERGGLFVAENLWEKSEIMQLKQTFTLQPMNCSEWMNVKVQKVISKKWSPNVGLEPTTLRLRVSCSTDWASRAT